MLQLCRTSDTPELKTGIEACDADGGQMNEPNKLTSTCFRINVSSLQLSGRVQKLNIGMIAR